MDNLLPILPKIQPITANIIQIMKHAENANVLMIITDQALYPCDCITIPRISN